MRLDNVCKSLHVALVFPLLDDGPGRLRSIVRQVFAQQSGMCVCLVCLLQPRCLFLYHTSAMLTWTCAIEGCGGASAPVNGSCFTCHKHLCGEHNALPNHACKGMSVSVSHVQECCRSADEIQHDEQVQLAAEQTKLEVSS